MLGLVPIEKLKPSDWDVRVLMEGDFERLKNEVRTPESAFPVVARWADGALEVISGVEMLDAAKRLGWKHLPVMLVENEEEALRFCLLYNPLSLRHNFANPGGAISYVKLAKLIAKDEKARRVCAELLGEKRTRDLLAAAERLTSDAIEILDKGVRRGANVTPEKLRVVAESPPELQPHLAYGAMEVTDVRFLKAVRDSLKGGEKA